ncbi:unnamed protein product [Closterium sp. NIES-64]|nr:unnamed protein product [Closterium sp. NIES-64]
MGWYTSLIVLVVAVAAAAVLTPDAMVRASLASRLSSLSSHSSLIVHRASRTRRLDARARGPPPSPLPLFSLLPYTAACVTRFSLTAPLPCIAHVVPDAMVPTIRPRCQAQRCSAVSVALMRSSSNLLPSGPFTHFQLPYGRGAKPNVPFLSPTVFAALRFVHVLCCPVALTLFSSTLCPSSPLPHAAAIPRQAQRPLPLAHGVRSAALRPRAVLLRGSDVPSLFPFSLSSSILPSLPSSLQLPYRAKPNAPFLSPTALAVLRFAHVLCCSVALGASVWVTFFAGVIMFRHLPRHTFGSIQGRLFPAYFRLMALSSALSALALKLTLNPAAAAAAGEAAGSGAGGLQQVQLLLLVAALSAALLNLLLFEPITTKIMRERHSIEKEAGIGQEVGLSRNREVARTNKELAAVNRRFGMWHGMSSLSNLVALCSLGANAWFLAQQLPV